MGENSPILVTLNLSPNAKATKTNHFAGRSGQALSVTGSGYGWQLLKKSIFSRTILFFKSWLREKKKFCRKV
jgi:hypothetical protein